MIQDALTIVGDCAAVAVGEGVGLIIGVNDTATAVNAAVMICMVIPFQTVYMLRAVYQSYS